MNMAVTKCDMMKPIWQHSDPRTCRIETHPFQLQALLSLQSPM